MLYTISKDMLSGGATVNGAKFGPLAKVVATRSFHHKGLFFLIELVILFFFIEFFPWNVDHIDYKISIFQYCHSFLFY